MKTRHKLTLAIVVLMIPAATLGYFRYQITSEIAAAREKQASLFSYNGGLDRAEHLDETTTADRQTLLVKAQTSQPEFMKPVEQEGH